MSKFSVVFNAPGMTSKEYDAIMDELLAQGKLPNPHLLSHAAFQKGESWCVVDVWDSEKACMDFGQQALFPVFQKLGVKVDQPQFYPVHNFVGSSAAEMLPV
jgi:hypothetical protein